jgi:hypothetical protein
MEHVLPAMLALWSSKIYVLTSLPSIPNALLLAALSARCAMMDIILEAMGSA